MNNKLKKIIANITGENENDIKENDTIIDDLGFDSIMVYDLWQTILNEFKINDLEDIDPKTWINDITVSQIQDKINAVNDEQTSFDESVSNINKFNEIEQFNSFFMDNNNNNPYFKIDDGIPTNHISIEGKNYINFSTYNYLGLNGSIEVENSAINAIKKYGTSVSGSRLLSGEIEIHKDLENEIANTLGVDSCVVQVGGHSTNVNTIGNVVNEKDLIIHDELAHNSILEGARLSHAMRRSFKHNDMESLKKLLKKLRNKYRRTLIIVEGAYSMDGDLCPLPELIDIKQEYGCILMIDEAHSFGTVGEKGHGVTEFFNVNSLDIDILMGTLSKSLASCGGYIAGQAKFINWIRYNSPGFVFSAGITPANASAALASLVQINKDNSYVKKLQENSKNFLFKVKELGYNTGNSVNTPIIPIIVGDSKKSRILSEKLLDSGINALPIVYPAVKEEEARIRFFMSSLHTEEDINYTVEVLKKLMKELEICQN